MKNIKPLCGWIAILMVMSIMIANSAPAYGENGSWRSLFPESAPMEASLDSLSLNQALYRVGQANNILISADYREESVSGLRRQAGAWPNPELGFEAEGIGGSLPGFSQSEWSLSLTQELELWGKRGARKALSEAEGDMILLEAKTTAFDIYTEAKYRFFEVLHAQNQLDLIKRAEELALEMVEALQDRVAKGASPITELQLAELEVIKIGIEVEESEVELTNTRKLMASMWGGADDFPSVKSVSDLPPVPAIDQLLSLIDQSRDIEQSRANINQLQAEITQSKAEARPGLALSAGIKRIKAEDINTFTLGLSMPLPLFNRNQGQQAALRSQIRAREAEVTQTIEQVGAEIKVIHERLVQLNRRTVSLSQRAVPKSESTFQSIREAYDAGKLSYTTLLDARQTALDLRQEQNHAGFAFRQEIIALERILGLRIDHISTR